MPFRILLIDDKIDDKTDDISQLPGLLEKAGYEVRATADGEAAWDLVWEYGPDLILLDVDLGTPETDGIKLCQSVRENEQAEGRPSVPIILITAVGELVKCCRLFCGGNFRPRPRITRIVGHIG